MLTRLFSRAVHLLYFGTFHVALLFFRHLLRTSFSNANLVMKSQLVLQFLVVVVTSNIIELVGLSWTRACFCAFT